jgi:membrane glycosyltransferase
MGVLIAPKLLGYIVTLRNKYERRGFGGIVRGFFSVVLETLISGLIAPVMMLIQSAAVAEILIGRDAGWSVQRRDDGTLPTSALARRYGWHTLFGFLLAAGAYAVSAPLLLWMTPVIVGLMLAVPLAALSANAAVGKALRFFGLLLIPEERTPPRILARANELTASSSAVENGEAFSLLCHNAKLRDAHRSLLQRREGRKAGEIDVNLVIGKAKLDEVASLHEAALLLSDREKAALLSDLQGFERLMSMCSVKQGETF